MAVPQRTGRTGMGAHAVYAAFSSAVQHNYLAVQECGWLYKIAVQECCIHCLFHVQIDGCTICTVRRRSRRTFSTHFEIFRRRFDGVVIYFFNSDFKFFDDASAFLVTSFLCCFYFLLKVHVNFFQFSIGTRAVVRSSRHRPFCFSNNYQKYATRISVCVIVVRKPQEFLLKVRRLSLFFFRRRRLRLHVDAS